MLPVHPGNISCDLVGPIDWKATRSHSHGHGSGGKQTQYRVLTLREFKEEIEGNMLNLLVMPMKNNPTLAFLTAKALKQRARFRLIRDKQNPYSKRHLNELPNRQSVHPPHLSKDIPHIVTSRIDPFIPAKCMDASI